LVTGGGEAGGPLLSFEKRKGVIERGGQNDQGIVGKKGKLLGFWKKTPRKMEWGGINHRPKGGKKSKKSFRVTLSIRVDQKLNTFSQQEAGVTRTPGGKGGGKFVEPRLVQWELK